MMIYRRALIAIFTSALLLPGCQREEVSSVGMEQEEVHEEKNVLKDYISNPQDQARDVNRQLEKRYEQIDQAVGE